MTIADASQFIIADPIEAVGTGAAQIPFLAEPSWWSWREAWQDVIDGTLDMWALTGDELEDDGVIPPTPTSIRRAHVLALEAQQSHTPYPPPDRVVPNGDGGIVFELWYGDYSETIEVLGDGSAEWARYHGYRLKARAPLPLTE